jgi:pilus assembly protein CpaE
VETTPELLIVGPDPRLPEEFAAALKGIADMQPVTHAVGSCRQGIEAARNRRPELAFVEMTRDLRALKGFAEEVAVCSPETVVAAVYAPDIFGPDVSESAILIEAMRAGVRDFLRRPLSSTDLRGMLERLLRRPAARTAKQGKIVSFMSNKGGVGKSTLAVNTACALARKHPEEVLLIDASLQMGVCATILNLRPATSLTDAVRERERLDELLLRQLATPHESGLHLLPAPADALEAAEIDDEIMARILNLARRAYHYVVVDSFPLLDRVMMVVLDQSDRSFLVLDSTVPTILGAAAFLDVLKKLGFPSDRLRVVLNRYGGFTGDLRPADVALRLGWEIDHLLPYEKKLLVAANLGKPYILSAGRFFAPWARALERLSAEIETLKPARGPAHIREAAASLNGEAGGEARKGLV